MLFVDFPLQEGVGRLALAEDCATGMLGEDVVQKWKRILIWLEGGSRSLTEPAAHVNTLHSNLPLSTLIQDSRLEDLVFRATRRIQYEQ